jgi:DNA repair exonuclease SbcCD ATPase subunit
VLSDRAGPPQLKEKAMRILFTADWHFDLKNLDLTVPAVEAMERIPNVDLFIHGGDLVVHRGGVHPHVSYHLRRAFKRLLGKSGGILVAGNHDDSYHAERSDTAAGIFGEDETTTGFGEKLLIASRPMIPNGTWGGDTNVAFVCIPTPSKYALAGLVTEGDSPASLLAEIIRGNIVNAREMTGPAGKVVVVYHGTIAGAYLGNEQVMPAGSDIQMPTDVFRGADLVLAGHIHEPQEFGGQPIWYAGAIAPLTWGERLIEPRVLVVDIENGEIAVTSHPLPVVCQMVERRIEAGSDQPAQVVQMIDDYASKNRGDLGGQRVRLIVSGPRSALAGITREVEDRWRTGVRDLTIVKEPTDDTVVRFEMGHGWTIIEAMKRWLEFKGTSPDSLDGEGILRCATEIESLVRDEHLDAHYDFQPKRLEASNWCQYPDLDIEFDALGKVVAVAGPNAAGKSNALRLLVWILYRRQLTGRGLADLVRVGEREMDGTLTFTATGREYRIDRKISVGTQGAGTSTVAFSTHDGPDGQWYVVNEGTAVETQLAIEKIVGPWRLFQWTVYAGQNAVDALVDLTPAEMKDVLVEVLQRDFASRERIAGERENILALSATRQRATAEAIRSVTKIPDEIRTELTATRDILAAMIAGPEPDVPAAEAAAGDARTAATVAAQAAHRRVEALKAEGLAADRLGSAQRATQAAANAKAAAAEHRAALGMEPQTVVLLDSLGRLDESLLAARAERDRVLNDGGRAAVAERKEVANAHAAWQAQVYKEQAARRVLDAAKAEIILMEQVPCMGEVWMGTGAVPVDMASCKFLERARAAKTQVGRYETEAIDADAIQEDLMKLHDDLLQLADAADIERAGRSRAAEAVVREIEAKREALNSEYRVAERELAAWNKANGVIIALETKAAELPALTEAMTTATMVHSEAQAYARMEAGADMDRAARELADAERRLAEVKAGAELLRVRRHGLETRIAVLAADLTNSEAALERATLADDGATDDEVHAAAWRSYRAAMARDGLPFILLEQYAIPGLRARANGYLARTDFRLAIDSTRETKEGKVRNEVVIRFEDGRGSHDLSAASGFQRTAIGMALRAALADLHAEATGSTLHLAIQDEGFGTMDPNNLDSAQATVREIAASRRWFFVISHVGGMSEAADTTLRVVDHGAYSTIETE